MSSIAPLIAAARRRIRRRNVIHGATLGAWSGVALGVLTLAASRLYWLDLLPPPWIPALLLVVISGLSMLVLLRQEEV